MRKPKLSLSTRILIGLGLGICCGLFFGEGCAWLGVIGDGFVKFLQMTVLPYVVVALVLRLGSLTYERAKQLALRGGILLLLFWTLGVLIPLAASLSMPSQEGGSFFSTNSVTPVAPVDYLDEYIPWNPFYSLANTVVPAVVLFSVFLGIALIGIKDKENILHSLSLLCDALTRITNSVVAMTPYGVFAIAANAAGTMTIHQLEALQVYFIIYIVFSLLITFVIMPVLASTLTPFSYRDVVSISKDALLTGFTTSSLFVVMPLISAGLRKMFDKHRIENEELPSSADIVIPIYYNLPGTGKLLSLVFLLFAGWYVGTPIPFSDYPYFGVSGFLGFLGNVNIAVPYLLKEFHLQSNLFELFVASGVINARFSTLAATMDLLVFSLLCACALTNMLKIQWKRLIPYWTGTLLIFCLAIVVTRSFFDRTVQQSFSGLERLETMSIANLVEAVILPNSPPLGDKIPIGEGSRLQQIKDRGVLRVGFDTDMMPFAYFNKNEQLVGFDVAMAHQLARDLGCKLELTPLLYEGYLPALQNNQVDIVMAGISVDAYDIQYLDFSEPYMDMHLALVVKSYKKDRFQDLEGLRRMKNLTVAAAWKSAFVPAFEQAVPNAKIVTIQTHLDFFSGQTKAEALLLSAETGSIWTLRYPEYGVVVPKPLEFKTMNCYAVAQGDPEFLAFLNTWVKIQKLNGFVGGQYKYWILGEEEKDRKPRWSIIENVLHWR